MLRGKSLFCMTKEGIYTKVQITYNTHTDHITISSSFSTQLNYREVHREETRKKNPCF